MLVELINFLTSIALFIVTIKAYLVINKMWRRKAIEEVADSISVTAKLMTLFSLSIYLVRAIFIERDMLIAVDLALGLALAFFTMMVGLKFWVPGRRKTLWASIKRAVKSEERELDNLLRGDKPPKEAELIARILYRIAGVDNHIADEEQALLENVASGWGLDLTTIAQEESAKRDGIETLPRMVATYLASQPDAPQARQALDLAQRLVLADRHLSDEEELVLGELVAMMQGYIDEVSEGFCKYAACLVPQTHEQRDMIAAELSGIEEARVAGGRAFVLGHFYSSRFAEAVCDQYRAREFMAVVVDARLKAV